MPQPKKPRRAILKEELVELCDGDHVTALVLERLLYKTRMAEEYAEMQNSVGKKSDDIDEADRGWINISASTLTKELMIGVSQKTVRRRLSDLVQRGYLMENLSNDKWRGTASYKVRTEFIQCELFDIGFVLDGYGLPGTEILMAKTTKPLPSEDPTKVWDTIPSASEEKMQQPKLPGIEGLAAWVGSQRLLTGAPTHVSLTSYLLWKVGGFSPHGSKKNWFSACNGLWEASGCNEHTLSTAIENGQSAREKRGLTMSGPRSFITFALDAKSRHELQGRGIDASAETRREPAQGKLNGQKVETKEDGKTIIKIGR